MAKVNSKRSRAAQMEPAERHQQLLRAGVACFAEKGIGGAKHADIARACDVSVPAVFSYFPSRDELVNSVLNDVGNTLIAQVLTPAIQLPKQEQLGATAPLYINLAVSEPDYVKVWLMWSMHFAPEMQAQFRKFETRALKILADMFSDDSAENDRNDLLDRARMLFASSAFLAKMVFDGVSEARQQDFVGHILESLAPNQQHNTSKIFQQINRRKLK